MAITDGERVLAEDNTLVLASDPASGVLPSHAASKAPARHGDVLIPRVQALLSAASIDLAQIDLVAVGVGPGSFTGLRVGLATAKGLAFALQKPVRGVSSIEVIAASVLQSSALAIVMLDAFKGEVYAGVFQRAAAQGAQPVPLLALFHAEPAVAAVRVIELLDGLASTGAKLGTSDSVLCGDGARRYADVLGPLLGSRTRLAEIALDAPRGCEVARAALRAFESEGPSDLATLEPTYVRGSDARLPDRPLSLD